MVRAKGGVNTDRLFHVVLFLNNFLLISLLSISYSSPIHFLFMSNFSFLVTSFKFLYLSTAI